jgi:acyl-ACP thioesterase
VMTDRRGLPVRVPAEFRAFIVQPPPSFTPTRVPLPATPEGAVSHTFPVRARELDPMGHVNNAVYLDHFEECVAALDGGEAAISGLPRTYWLEYLLPAEPGANLQGEAWTSPDGSLAFRLTDAKMTELFRGRLEA